MSGASIGRSVHSNEAHVSLDAVSLRQLRLNLNQISTGSLQYFIQ